MCACAKAVVDSHDFHIVGNNAARGFEESVGDGLGMVVARI